MNYLRNFDERSDDELEDLVAGVDEEVNDGIAADAPNVGRVRAAVPNITRPRNGGISNRLPWLCQYYRGSSKQLCGRSRCSRAQAEQQRRLQW